MEPNNTTPEPPVNETNLPAPAPELPSNAPIATQPVTGHVKTKKKLFGKLGVMPAVIVAAAVLISGSAAAYLGLVLPNQPENIWKTALDNTSQGYDKFVEYAEEQKDTNSGNVKGTFKIENAEFVTDGNIDGKFDPKNSNIAVDAGVAGTRMKFNILTNIPEGASTPDIYLKAEGLQGLANLIGNGDPQTAQMLAGINNQYYFIDHTLLEQLQKQATNSTAAPEVDDIKAEDIVDFMKQVGEVNNEYIFTSDSSKAVFTVKEEVGKETINGREAYHFKVALDKEHIKVWNQAVCDRLLNHKVMKALSGVASDEDRKKECEDVTDYDNIDENQTADVWVDMKTKLIRDVRIAEKDGKATYDFGLLYDGGDEYPFYITVKDEEQGDMTLKTTVNTASNVVTLVANGVVKSGEQNGNIDLNLTFTPSNDVVEFTKPDGAKSLSDLLAPFIGGLTGPSLLDQTDQVENDFSFE